MKGMKSNRREKVLILDAETDLPRDVYDPAAHWAHHLERFGISYRSVKVDCPFSLEAIGTSTHIIITGSSASVAKEAVLPDWFENAAQFVRYAIDHQMPVLGVCFGHQFLARMLAGADAVRRARFPGVGWQTTTVTQTDPILGPAEQTFSAFHLHFDEVTNLPVGAVVLAHTPSTPISAFALPDRYVWGIQAHPEITPADGKFLLEKMQPCVPKEKREYFKRALATEANDSGYIDKIILSFRSQGLC